MKNVGGSVRKLFYTVLIVSVALVAYVSPSLALWNSFLLENFERAENLWPWQTDGHAWFRYPEPPNSSRLVWAVEESSLFHYTTELYYRSLWASGDPDFLLPGTDNYPGNQDSWAKWGPFSLAEAVEAGGNFWMWAEMEAWNEGAGDNFYVLCTSTQATANGHSRAQWCEAYSFDQASTLGRWVNRTFDFATLDSAGDTVSYIGRNQIWIAFVFQSDADQYRGRGVFIDDIALGYDDGLFDYEALTPSISFVSAADTLSLVDRFYRDEPVRLRLQFRARGPQPTTPATMATYLNDVLFDSARAVWESSSWGITNRPLLSMTWNPADTGNYVWRVELDINQEEMEAFEDNNSWTDTVYVNEPNLPPWIEWLNPSDDTLRVQNPEAEIMFIAHNSPVFEEAYVSFYYDVDQDGYNGHSIPGQQGRYILNIQDSFIWDMEDVIPGQVYYVYAILNDNYYEPQFAYCPYPVIYEGNAAPEQSVGIPTEFSLQNVYPNPFNPTVEISVALPSAGNLDAVWYSLDGRLIATQNFPSMQAGYRSFTWTPTNIASGLYLLRISHPAGSATTKVLYLK